MSLDGLAIRALAEELHHTLVDGRIDKIQQPDNHSLRHKTFTLLSP